MAENTSDIYIDKENYIISSSQYFSNSSGGYFVGVNVSNLIINENIYIAAGGGNGATEIPSFRADNGGTAITVNSGVSVDNLYNFGFLTGGGGGGGRGNNNSEGGGKGGIGGGGGGGEVLVRMETVQTVVPMVLQVLILRVITKQVVEEVLFLRKVVLITIIILMEAMVVITEVVGEQQVIQIVGTILLIILEERVATALVEVEAERVVGMEETMELALAVGEVEVGVEKVQWGGLATFIIWAATEVLELIVLVL